MEKGTTFVIIMQVGRLKTELAGMCLCNPTVLASGILGVSVESLREVIRAGAGAVTTKSVGLKPREPYSNPTVIQVDCGILNAVGLPNPGIKKFAEEIKSLAHFDVPIIVSIYGYSEEEYKEVAKKAEKAGASALEINLSCPHVKGVGAEIGQTPHSVKKVVENVKSEVKIPVFAKLTPNIADISKIAKSAVAGGADGITAINTVSAMAIDVQTARPILSNKIGGLSGGAIKPIAIRCVYQIHKAVKIPIMGCGGVRTWQDAVEFLLAGASAVQIGSSIVYEDLAVFRSVTEGIDTYLERKGFRNVKDIVGLAHRY